MPTQVVNGARHYYRLEGANTRPRLMLVHPVGADLSLWDKVMPGLLERFCILRYDIRGHGGTEVTRGDYTIDMLADDLLQLAAGLRWARFAVCGVSIGAMAAVKAAAMAPERVASLVVCSASPRMSAPPGGWDQRAALVRAQGTSAMVESMAERMFSASFRATGDPQIETLKTVLARMDPEGYAACLAVLRDADLRGELKKIVAPTLIVTGRQDALVPASASEEFSRGICAATVSTMIGGHFPPIESPEEFDTAICSFVSVS